MCSKPPQQWDCNLRFVILIAIMGVSGMACSPGDTESTAEELVLHEGWRIQSAAETADQGEILSSADASIEGWYPAIVPRTVLAVLVDNGEYQDPYFGTNMEHIPADRFSGPWWYRTTFELTAAQASRKASLVFEGVNYRADIWLNGRQIASPDVVTGSFRIFSFAVESDLQAGTNVLAVMVYPPQPGDFTIGFVDWNPRPPDRNMGIWRPVRLRLTGDVAIDSPFVRTRVDLETLASADITVNAALVNRSEWDVEAVANLDFMGQRMSKKVPLPPGSRVDVVFAAQEFSALHLENPDLWWPNGLGDPHLYSLQVSASVGDTISDRHEVRFGVREVGDYYNAEGHRGYTVNGHKVLIRGGGWVDDLMLADDERRVRAQLRYAREMNLNTIRLEGFWGSSPMLYDLADEYGLLVMVGWSCQWEWEGYLGKEVDEFGGIRTPEDIRLITDSLRDQVLWLRNHPSIFVWVFGSDALPRLALEKGYLQLLEEIDPSRPTLSACSVRTSEVSGPTGVKMNGPYDYVTPNYWYEDRTNGGAFGFNTETGPGPQPPPLASLERMIPADHLWPVDEVWNYHCGRNEFNTMDRYLNALNHRYGEPRNVEEFSRLTQLANYEAIRPMFEAFSVNKPNATGVIQWMLNSAWPETYWQLYDWYLMPNGAYFGTKAACRPVNLIYSYGDGNVYAVNDSRVPKTGLRSEVRVLDSDSRELMNRKMDLDLEENSSQLVLEMPDLSTSPVHFLQLRLLDGEDREVSRNFYWLSAKKDVLDSAGTEWFVTPNRSFADFKSLRSLPKVALRKQTSVETVGSDQIMTVTLENPSDKLAFFVELTLVGRPSGDPVLPVYWDDNYLSLLPGERRVVRAEFATSDLGGEQPEVRVNGMNLDVD